MQNKEDNILIPAGDAAKLIKAHDGNMSLLYLYYKLKGGIDREDAAESLCITGAELSSAMEKLARSGLIDGSSGNSSAEAPSVKTPKAADKRAPARELPNYTAEDVVSLSGSDSGFRAVLDEAESVFGRLLSSDEMKRFCSIYQYLGLPAEVIIVLLHYCAEISSGNSRKLTVNFVEKQAYSWLEKEICTAEQAEDYSEHIRSLRTELGKVRAALDIKDRSLTTTEEKYIMSWLEMGFNADTIYEAYDLTVTKTGKRAYSYMNSVLLNWHDNGNSSTAPGKAGKKIIVPPAGDLINKV